jgi:hypothetical protein
MKNIESGLFSKLTKEKSLKHPTARNFNADLWLKEAGSLSEITDRDRNLLTAALFYGNQLKALRSAFENRLFESLDQRTGLLLSLSMANYNYSLVGEKSRKAAKELNSSRGFFSSSGAHEITITSSLGNKISPDVAITAIVDTLPHCFERAAALPPKSDAITDVDLWKIGARLFSVMSIEHALRDLWQQVCWDGWALHRLNDEWRQEPVDRDLAEQWTVWHARHEKIAAQGSHQDALEARARRYAGKSEPSFLQTTVVGIGGHSK